MWRASPAGNVITEPETDRVLGFIVNAEKPQTVWVDEKEARTQATIDRALPGMRNAFRRFPNSSRVLISSYSDVSPEKFFLLDEQKKTLEELFTSKPWLTKDRLVEMRPFILKTRDGLEIPSYYFLPRNYKPGDKVPTVLHVHGGPHVRADTWARGFGYKEAEILASRGYAVILPNFRVTPGFGGKIFKAGFGTVGRQMSEDHEDAVKWAIDQGFADPNAGLHLRRQLRRLRGAAGTGQDARHVQVRRRRARCQRPRDAADARLPATPPATTPASSSGTSWSARTTPTRRRCATTRR